MKVEVTIVTIDSDGHKHRTGVRFDSERHGELALFPPAERAVHITQHVVQHVGDTLLDLLEHPCADRPKPVLRPEQRN